MEASTFALSFLPRTWQLIAIKQFSALLSILGSSPSSTLVDFHLSYPVGQSISHCQAIDTFRLQIPPALIHPHSHTRSSAPIRLMWRNLGLELFVLY